MFCVHDGNLVFLGFGRLALNWEDGLLGCMVWDARCGWVDGWDWAGQR